VSRIPGVNYNYSGSIFDIHKEITFTKNPKLIVILLSGHGFSIVDRSGDEIDNKDEAITFGSGMITDDVLFDNIVATSKSDMLLFSDTCHSGTMFDLPYWWTPLGFTCCSKKTGYPQLSYNMISLAACNDNQLSMCDIGDETGFGGSLTTGLLNISGVLYSLIESFNSTVDRIDTVVEIYEKLKTRLALLNQTVVLSSSKK
jgi:hypothetical protein